MNAPPLPLCPTKAKSAGSLRAVGLRLGYGDQTVVDDLSVAIPDAKIVAIIGANGSGKSTLLKALGRILTPFAGNVLLDGAPIHEVPTRLLARVLSILPQNPAAPDGLTVFELVSYGRFPHRRGFARLGHEDLRMIRWALEMVGLEELQDRSVNCLSGGQQQRVWIAMTLAQGAGFLLLDEPTSHLDMCHQLEIMGLLRRLNRNEHRTVVMVLHDLNLAARYADHMIALKDGKIVHSGTPEEVMVGPVLREVFGIEARILLDPETSTPLCVPYLSPENGETARADT